MIACKLMDVREQECTGMFAPRAFFTSLGKFTFLLCRVCAQFFIGLRASSSSMNVTSSFVKTLPSGICSLFRSATVCCSDIVLTLSYLLFFPCLSLLIYVSEFCRTQLITQKFLFLKAKQWITSDMKVWINTALLTFLITEHIYSYDNVFFNNFFMYS